MNLFSNYRFTLAGLIVIGRLSFGWGDLGHEMVGELAYRNLTPQAKKMVFEVIGAEPLAKIATFPDSVRSDKAFSKFAPFHFVEVPPGKTVEEALAQHPTKKNGHTVVKVAERLVPQKTQDVRKRALLLRYLVHVVGDVHQPLHVGNGVDRGANLCRVKWVNAFTGKEERSNLHTVWDTEILTYIRKDFEAQAGAAGGNKYYFNYNDAIELVMKKFTPEKLEALKKRADVGPEGWYLESFELHPRVYPDPKPVKDPKEHTYCSFVDETGKEVPKEIDPDVLPVLDEKYAREALALVEERIILGGYRLAHFLNTMAKNHQSDIKNDDPMVDFLNNLNMEKLLPATNAKKKANRTTSGEKN